MYIYGLECLYEAFVLHSNSFLEYYSLFIEPCKVYSSDLYSTPTFLPEVPNQHNPLDTIPSYLTNLQQMPKPQKYKFHVAAYINWRKIGLLQFYNNSQHDPEVIIKKPIKPRHRPTRETTTEYKKHVCNWETSIPKNPEIKHSNNSITIKYYTDNILPNYLGALAKCHVYYNKRAILQKNNNDSHGTHSENNLAITTKKKTWAELLKHPANSPDLNTTEAC